MQNTEYADTVIEKIEKNPSSAKKIGIKDKTKEKLQERRGVRV